MFLFFNRLKSNKISKFFAKTQNIEIIKYMTYVKRSNCKRLKEKTQYKIKTTKAPIVTINVFFVKRRATRLINKIIVVTIGFKKKSIPQRHIVLRTFCFVKNEATQFHSKQKVAEIKNA